MSPCHHVWNVLGKCVKCGQTQLPGDSTTAETEVKP